MRLAFAGIGRAKRFSPNHIDNDALILSRTARELEKLGASVELFSEDNIENIHPRGRFVFTMARSDMAISLLNRFRASGCMVVNSPESIVNCRRENITNILTRGGVPYPKSVVVSTSRSLKGKIEGFSTDTVWVKSQAHVIHREDVSQAQCEAERNNILKEFCMRGIARAVVQEHVEGSEVKFYGVRGTEFFYWYYTNHRPGAECDESLLAALAGDCADLADIEVYGGDAIITYDGGIHIIDFNDWPSFAPVRDIAASFIAGRLYELAAAGVESGAAPARAKGIIKAGTLWRK